MRPCATGSGAVRRTDGHGRRGWERYADRPQERYADRPAPRMIADLHARVRVPADPASILRTSVIRANGLLQAMVSQATTVQYRPNKSPNWGYAAGG